MMTRHDVEQLIVLAGEAFTGTRYARYPVSPTKCRRIAELTEQSDEVLVLVAADEMDRPVGFLAGLISEHYFADMVYATNLALYVSPEARGGRVAIKLIRHFERLARARGAQEIVLGVTAGVGAGIFRTEKFYNALGYETIGASTVKYLGE